MPPWPHPSCPSAGAAGDCSHPPGRGCLPDLQPVLQAGTHRALCLLAAGPDAGAHAGAQGLVVLVSRLVILAVVCSIISLYAARCAEFATGCKWQLQLSATIHQLPVLLPSTRLHVAVGLHPCACAGCDPGDGEQRRRVSQVGGCSGSEQQQPRPGLCGGHGGLLHLGAQLRICRWARVKWSRLLGVGWRLCWLPLLRSCTHNVHSLLHGINRPQNSWSFPLGLPRRVL